MDRRSAIFFIVPRRILPERVFGRRGTTMASLERGDRADLVAHQLHDLLLDLLRRPVDARFQHHEAAGLLALDLVLDAEHGAFGDVRMRGHHLLHAAGRQAMAGDVDDVVGAAMM